MRKINLWFLLILCVFAKNLYSQDTAWKLRIDPGHAYGGNLSDFFDFIEYIPLETRKESLFGDANEMIVTDQTYVIYDNDTQVILFFSLDGKYLSKIKLAKGTSNRISFVKLEKKIIVRTFNPNTGKETIQFYSTTGVKLAGYDSNTGNSLFSNKIAIGDGYWVNMPDFSVVPGKSGTDSVFHLINIYKDEKLHKSLLPYNQANNLGICVIGGSITLPNHTDSSGSIYITTPLEYYLFKITKDTAKKIGEFIFPKERCIPKNIIYSTSPKIVDSAYNNLSETETIIDVSNIFFHKNRLFFKINTRAIVSAPGSEEKYLYNFIFDTISKRLYSLDRVIKDTMSYYLPVLGNSALVTGVINHNGNLYSSLSSLQMFAAKNAAINKNPQYPPVLKEYFKTQSRKSNPVIVKMKLKE